MTKSMTVSINLSTVGKIGENETLRDKSLSGFGVRRQGEKTVYFIRRRVNGRKVYITIGIHGDGWNPTTARARAEELAREMKSGVNPAAVRRKARDEALSVSEGLDRFLSVHGAKVKERTLEEYTGLAERYLKPAFGRLDVQEVDEGAVEVAHARWRNVPRAANHALAVLSKFMSWCEEQKLRPRQSNPCVGVKRYPENKRDRYLETDEVARIGQALDELELEGKFGRSEVGAVRFLMLSGARKSEALTLQWCWFDRERMVFSLPDSKTGKKRLAVNEAVVELLEGLPRSKDSEFVFTGRNGTGRLYKLVAIWDEVRKRADVGDVRLHDLRHSYASFAIELGVSVPAVGRALGHGHINTTQRYIHVRDRALSEGINRTGSFINGLMKRKASAGSDGASDSRAEEVEA